MKKLKCYTCEKEIDATPFYELHKWSYDEYGTLMGTSEIYCNKRCLLQ